MKMSIICSFAEGRSESPSQCNPFQCELSAAVYSLLWIWEKEGIDRFIGPLDGDIAHCEVSEYANNTILTPLINSLIS